MKIASIVVAAAGLCATLPAAAATFAVKPGAWEMNVTTTTSGNMLSPEALARMTPERRAMVDKMLNDRSGQPTTMTRKACIRKADLDSDRFLKNDRSDCTVRTVSKSETRLVLSRTCPGTPPSQGTVTLEAQSPESVVGVVEQQRGDGSVRIEIAGKWLGASCEGIEPVPRTRK